MSATASAWGNDSLEDVEIETWNTRGDSERLLGEEYREDGVFVLTLYVCLCGKISLVYVRVYVPVPHVCALVCMWVEELSTDIKPLWFYIPECCFSISVSNTFVLLLWKLDFKERDNSQHSSEAHPTHVLQPKAHMTVEDAMQRYPEWYHISLPGTFDEY